MFSIGFGELAVICIVLIIAVGPERLPSMMKTVGKTMRTLRQASRDIRTATGIDELMREDIDLYSQPKPKRPQPAPGPAPVSRADVPAALPAVLPAELLAPNEAAADATNAPAAVAKVEPTDDK